MNKLKISLLISLLVSVLVVFAANAFNSPSACSGSWSNCNNAFGDNANRATANVNVNGVWQTYGFSVPAGASVDSVVVRSDFYSTRTSGYINVRVSGDGGSTFGPVHTVGGNTAEQTFLIDVTSDLSWTPDMLSNSNLVVNVTCVKQGGGPNPKCNLDWLPVNVSYTPFDFSVSLSPSVASVNHSNNVTTDVNVTLLSGTSENVNLSVQGCPWSSTCSFVPSSGNPTYSSVLTVATSSSTPTSTYLINVTGTSAGLTRRAVFNLTVTGLCTRANPFVLIQPDTQSGTNGSLLIYTTNVTNNDSADCGFSQFNLSKVVPAGWTGVLTSFVSIWAGDLASVEFNLTSNSSATPGNYSFNISALNSKASSFTGVDSAVYEVV